MIVSIGDFLLKCYGFSDLKIICNASSWTSSHLWCSLFVGTRRSLRGSPRAWGCARGPSPHTCLFYVWKCYIIASPKLSETVNRNQWRLPRVDRLSLISLFADDLRKKRWVESCMWVNGDEFMCDGLRVNEGCWSWRGADVFPFDIHKLDLIWIIICNF